MEVGVRVVARTCSAYLTIVALDENENPVQVHPLEPSTPNELRRQREANLRRDARLALTSHIMIRPPATGRNTPVR